MEWRDIKGYEGYYQVSNTGLVKAVNRTVIFSDGRKRSYPEKILPAKEWFKNGHGYLMVTLTKHHKMKGFSVHRLVAEAFIPNPNNYPQINHKDKNRSNNKVENLEWCDARYNNRYSNNIRIIQYDNNWNKLKIWPCIIDAAKTLNIPSPNIINCCRKKQKSAGGFFWCYEEDESMSNELILSEEEQKRRREYARSLYYRNVEKSREKARVTYHKHREEYNTKRKESYHENIEERRAYHREWYHKNKNKN